MKAVILVRAFSSQLRPLTLTLPLPLLDLCNETILSHQLRALKEAGISEVVICYHEEKVPQKWDAAISQLQEPLGISIVCSQEEEAMGTAGAIKNAEELITDSGRNESPFIVVNSDVLCSYPLKDLLRAHVKHGRQGTLLTTRMSDRERLRNYGVVVSDERTGAITHFVERPETFVSDLVNAGVYAFSPAIFERIPAGRRVSMNELLPAMAKQQQLHSLLLTGYYVKLTDTASYMAAVTAQLEISRFLSSKALASSCDSYTIHGDVIIHPTAKIGDGCELGPSVVVGANCVLDKGVKLEDVTLMEGVHVHAHTLVRSSLVGWGSEVGRWCFVTSSVLGERVRVDEMHLINSAIVLPHKRLDESIRKPEIVI